jgi:hypothetical protein
MERIPERAFTRVALYAYVDADSGISTLFTSSAENLLQEVVSKAQRMLGGEPGKVPRGEPIVDWRKVDSSVQLTAYRDGRLVARKDKDPRSAASLMGRALDSIETAAVLDWSAEAGRDSISFNISFARPFLDSTGKVHSPVVHHTMIPLLSIAEPWERGASQKPNQPHPHYPDEARRENYEGLVILTFIVDSTGRVDESTIHDVWPPDKPRLRGHALDEYNSFVEASTAALRRMEFVPASIGGCPVRQLVQMPFAYGLNR